MPKLKNHRREKFCQFIHAGKSQRESYELAGFKASRKNAWSLRQAQDIKRRLDELNRIALERERAAIARAAERYAVTIDRIVAELARIAFANSLDYWTIDGNGQPQIDLSKVNRDRGAAISEFTIDQYMDGKSENAREVKQVRIKLHDKRSALVDLGRYLNLFHDTSTLKLTQNNYFSEKPPSLAEWRKEIELQAKERNGEPS
jgi:phage terminase small subunit